MRMIFTTTDSSRHKCTQIVSHPPPSPATLDRYCSVHSTVGLFQVTPRTLWESGPSSLKPKDEGNASKHSSSNSRPLSRQLLRRASKSWFRYLTACELLPTPRAFSRLCWSLSTMPGMFVGGFTGRQMPCLCEGLVSCALFCCHPCVSTPRCPLCLGIHLALRHLLHLLPRARRDGK